MFSRGSPAPARQAPAPARPAPQQAAPPMAAPQQSGGMMSGLMRTVATGMAFGAGSEIAHQGVKAMMGSGSSQSAQQQQAAPEQQQAAPMQQQYAEQQQPAYNPCENYSQWFISCLKQNENNIASCPDYMTQLNQCERDNSSSLNQF